MQEVGDTTAAEVSFLLLDAACLFCVCTPVKDCPIDQQFLLLQNALLLHDQQNKMMCMLLFSQNLSQAAQPVHVFNVSTPCCLRSKQQAVDTV